MKKYTHNGVEVLVQSVRYDDFVKNLNDHGITPVELPVYIYHYVVLRYELEGITKYAVSGTERYETFLTTQVPEDSWESLIKDCQGQANGEKPEKLRSRFNMMLAKAEENAFALISTMPNDLPIMSVMGLSRLPKEGQDAFLSCVKVNMTGYGYDKKYVNGIQLTPLAKEIITKILNDEYYW